MSEEAPIYGRSGAGGASAPLEWVRPPLQVRSQATLERLLDAAEALIEEKGFDDVPVAEIARRARSSVGALYTRFRDKNAILYAVHERFCDEAHATCDAALDPERWVDVSIPEIASAVVVFLVRIIRQRAGLSRTLLTRVGDPEVRERAQRTGRYVNEALTRLLLERRGEITHPEPELACDFACRQIFFVLEPLVADAGFDPGRIPLDDDRIAVELTRSFLAYLGVRGAHQEDPA